MDLDSKSSKDSDLSGNNVTSHEEITEREAKKSKADFQQLEENLERMEVEPLEEPVAPEDAEDDLVHGDATAPPTKLAQDRDEFLRLGLVTCGVTYASGKADKVVTHSLQGVRGGAPFTEAIAGVDVGAHHYAVLDTGGHLWTQGSGEYGAVGRTSKLSQLLRLTSLEQFFVTDVACGDEYTLCCTSNGELFSFGRNDIGQLGHGTREGSSRPRRVKALSSKRVVQVAAGRSHSLALCRTGELYGWGDGYCGVGDIVGSKTPLQIKTLFGVPLKQIVCGVDFSLALSNSGETYSWGSNRFGQLGCAHGKDVLRPTHMKTLAQRKISQVAAGERHALALSVSGQVYSWGSDAQHQLARQGTTGTPGAVFLGATVVHIAANRKHSFFVTDGQRVISTPALCDFSALQGVPTRLFAAKDALHVAVGDKTPPATYRGVELMDPDRLDIGLVFSSPSALSGTFGEDYPRALQVMQGVIDSGDAEKQNELASSWSRLVRVNLPLVNLKLAETQSIPLMFFLNPWASQPAHFHSVTNYLMDHILRQPASVLRSLSAKWAQMPLELYSTTVANIATQLSYLLRHRKDAYTCVRFFDIVHSSNEGRLPESSFYNKTLGATMNWKKEFGNWSPALAQFSWLQYPYLLPPVTKRELVRLDAQRQMREQYASSLTQLKMPYTVIPVNRQQAVRDTFRALSPLSSAQLKRPLKVVFLEEEGVDEGGLTKELMLMLLKQLLNPDLGLFSLYPDSGMYWFNAASLEAAVEYELVGLVLGLAMYNSVLLDVHFPPFFYQQLLPAHERSSGTLEDLAALDPALARGLRSLAEYQGEEWDLFGLTMSIDYSYFGETRTHEFVPGGADIEIDSARRASKYVQAYVDFILITQCQQQSAALVRGFRRVCDSHIYNLISPSELEMMVAGDAFADLDFSLLQRHAKYIGYTASSAPVELFWQVVAEFSPEQKRDLLRFFTSSPLVPIEGLVGVPITLQKSGDDESRLPSAHTCFNIIDLPPYSTKEVLKEKLLYAIQAQAGFNLL